MAEKQLLHTADEIDKAIDRSVENENAIAVLNGTGTGSVSKTVADEVAKIVSGAPEDFDTLKEMSDWLTEHSDSASEMNSKILENTGAIATHEAHLTAHDSAIGNCNSGIAENKTAIGAVEEQSILNQQTLGYERKNLCPINEATLTGAGYAIGSSANPQAVYIRKGTITVSWTGTATTGLSLIIFRDAEKEEITRLQINNAESISAEIELQSDAYYMTLYSNVANALSEIMIRDARISDNTYVPYKESVAERLAKLEALVATLTTTTEV